MNKIIYIFLLVIILLSCSVHPEKPITLTDEPDKKANIETSLLTSYAEGLNRWRNPEDISQWIGENFFYDMKRAMKLSETQKKKRKRIPIYSPEELYLKKSGVCVDLSRFGVETLKAVAPNYNPKYLMINFDPLKIKGNVLRRHWIACYSKKGKYYFFADSKCPEKNLGPYGSVEDFIKEYEKFRQRKIVSYKILESFKKKKREKLMEK